MPTTHLADAEQRECRRPCSSNSPAAVSAGMAMKNDSRVAVTRSSPREQAGRDRGARAGDAGDQREALHQPDHERRRAG